MKTIKIVHRTVLAGLLASTILGGITLLGMDSNLDSSDEETHELAGLTSDESTSNSGIWTLLTSQVAGARSLLGYGRSLLEDLLLTEHSAQLSQRTDESNSQNNKKELLTLFLTDKDAYNQQTQCLPKDMKLLLARSLLNGLPLVDFILARLGSLCCLNTLQGHGSAVYSAEFNSAGDRMVTASWDNTAKIWDVASGNCLHTLRGHRNVCSAQFNSIGDKIVTASGDKTAKIWNVASGNCLHTLWSHSDTVYKAHFNDAGDRIVTASVDKTAKIWDVATGACLHTLQGHGDFVHSAQFNSAGDKIVTASWDRTAKIWDVASGNCLHTLRSHGNYVNSAQFNSTRDRIVTASDDRTAKIWDVVSGKCLHTLQGHVSDVDSAQFNGAEDRILTASKDRTIKIWDVVSGKCLHTLQSHSNTVCSAQFNSAGDRIITTSWDKTAKIWDVASGRCLHTLQGHGRAIYSAQFNSAGDRIVTASHDNTAAIWDVWSILTSTNWLKKECSLEQALLLHCIYEARIAGHGLRKYCPHLQANSDELPHPVFDFNAFPHLRECFEALPALIQKCLAEFVINTQGN